MQKVVIAGSRDITDKEYIRYEMNNLWKEIGPFELISGGARGVDRVSAELAEVAGIQVHYFMANWAELGRKAGYLRNVEMAKVAEYGLIIWDGKSPGTKHMMDIMSEMGKPTDVVIKEN